MSACSRIVFYGIAGLFLSVVHAWPLELRDLVGAWVAEQGSERIEFRLNGDVLDFRLGQGRFSTNVIDGAANMAVVYQGNQWCYYYASMAAENKALFLARRNPRQDPWLCTEGRFTPVK